MENAQALEPPQAHETPQARIGHEQADIEFRVSYLDTESGRVMEDQFGDLASAERFANAQLKDEEAWAVVDAVGINTVEINATSGDARGRTGQDKRTGQLVA